jgi:hypothetical protein
MRGKPRAQAPCLGALLLLFGLVTAHVTPGHVSRQLLQSPAAASGPAAVATAPGATPTSPRAAPSLPAGPSGLNAVLTNAPGQIRADVDAVGAGLSSAAGNDTGRLASALATAALASGGSNPRPLLSLLLQRDCPVPGRRRFSAPGCPCTMYVEDSGPRISREADGTATTTARGVLDTHLDICPHGYRCSPAAAAALYDAGWTRNSSGNGTTAPRNESAGVCMPCQLGAQTTAQTKPKCLWGPAGPLHVAPPYCRVHAGWCCPTARRIIPQQSVLFRICSILKQPLMYATQCHRSHSCLPGEYCPAGSQERSTASLASCQMNSLSYNPTGVAGVCRGYMPCPAGNYCPNASVALPCESGRWCAEGATGSEPCNLTVRSGIHTYIHTYMYMHAAMVHPPVMPVEKS